jgi:YebC/PmpR family DNA-binding regulatory protein
MAGHSKWANIQHRKGRQDAKRGKAFSKVAKLIMQAARDGADPDYNLKLRYAVEKAKACNMPKDKIESNIKKGSGQMDGYNLEEVKYEGYSSAGIAILVETLTDNRNRTTPEMRNIFSKRGGKLSTPNSVAYKFTAKGLFLVSGIEEDEDEFLEFLIDSGMEDYIENEGEFEITTPAESFGEMQKALEGKGLEFKSQITKVPTVAIPVDEEGYRKTIALIEDLEDHDDVQDVYADFDVSDEILASVENE